MNTLASRLILILFVSQGTKALAGPQAVPGGGGLESPVVAVDSIQFKNWAQFDGHVVSQVKFLGLVRSREFSTRWFVHTTEGKAFDAKQLSHDLQNLANTQ